MIYILLFAGILNLALGIYVFKRGRNKSLNVAFSALSSLTGLWVLNNFIFRIYPTEFFLENAYSLGLLSGLALVYWSLILTDIHIPRRILLLFTIICIFFALIIHYDNLLIQNYQLKDSNSLDIVPGVLYFPYSIFLFILFIVTIFSLIKGFLKSSGISRQQLKYVLIGVCLSVSIIIIVDIILPLYAINSLILFDTPSTLIFNFSIAYAITRYRLMAIRAVVTKSILYFFMVALVASVLVFTTVIATEVLLVGKGGNFILTMLASFIIVVFMDPLKRLLSRITDDIFYKDKIDYDQVLTKLALIIAKEIDLEVLLSEVSRGLLNELKLKRVEIVINSDNRYYILRNQQLEPFNALVNLISFLSKQSEPVVLEELRRQQYDMQEGGSRQNLTDLISIFELQKWEMVVPVIIEKQLVAIIASTNKLSGDIYGREDINFFKIFAPQVAVAIEKSKLYEEINKFNRELQGKIDRATEKLRQTNIDLEARNKYLITTQNISNLISRSLDINNIIQIIADSIASELGYIGGILSFVDESGKYLYPAAITRSQLAVVALKILPKHPSEYRTNITQKENLGAQAFLSGNAIVDTDLVKFLSPPVEPEAIKKIQSALGIQTIVAVPIYSENKIIGVIEYLLTVPESQIQRLDHEMMNNLADQVGIVYRNVKLYQELQSTNVELQQANVHLKQLDKAKSEFLSIASHQLRTPISAVKGYLSMLLEGDFGSLQPEQAKIITDIFESASRLARLINIFLNVSRIESGRFKLAPALTDMNTIVESVVKELQQQAKVKNLELVVQLPTKPVTITVDSDKIREVILNLVDNAIKYTQQGSITVSHELKSGEYHFVTKDTGMGILPEEVSGLFRKFVRGSGVAQVNTQGSGLGLYIAQRVVAEHGGKIWAESPGVGKGSTFQFTVPVVPPSTVTSEEMKNGNGVAQKSA